MSGTAVFFLPILLLHYGYSAVVNETLVFTRGIISADNFPQEGILINGQFPGPPISVNKNDSLIINVINKLPGNFTLHLHGILQIGSVQADGVGHVTQSPIPPNGSYVYSLKIGHQSGTFMYHAHTDLDLVWAFGPLIIKDNNDTNPFAPKEVILQLSQCWHVPIEEIQQGLLGSPFEDVPDTASLLINGRSWGEWNNSLIEDPPIVKTEGYEVINVRQNESYKFRVIGMGMDSMLALFIDNHTNLQITEVDGVQTDPIISDHLQLNSAQRYSILVTMDQPIDNYWIRSEMLPGPGPRNGRAILHYEGAPDPTEMRTELFEDEADELELDTWVLDELHPSTTINQEVVYPVPTTIDREIIIKSLQANDETNHTKFDINGLLHQHTQRPLLHMLLDGQDILTDKSFGVYEILLGERIQIVFENRMSDDGECEQHPWHMHGHTFYVVGRGSDSYDPILDGERINQEILNGTNSYRFRDVVTLFPNQTVENTNGGEPCGWTAIRFIADNPGLWLVHCHLTPHQIMGKWFVLYEHGIGNKKLSTIIDT